MIRKSYPLKKSSAYLDDARFADPIDMRSQENPNSQKKLILPIRGAEYRLYISDLGTLNQFSKIDLIRL